MLDRRQFLGFTGLGLLTMATPQLAFARVATEKRFVFVLQRGAADGLSIVMPTGDPGFVSTRGALADDAAGGMSLDSTFTLNQALSHIGSLYRARQALFAQAVASNYRERSHFDGQNVLETAGSSPYQLRDGWLNRFIAMLPQDQSESIAVASAIPAVLRGSAPVSSYAPSNLPDADTDLLMRVSDMYDGDPVLHALWAQAVETDELAGDLDGNIRNGQTLGVLAARLLTGPEAARIAVLETSGWDTHSNQTTRLTRNLSSLDALLSALQSGLGSAWNDTVVVVATEFGRTVAPNGTRGTDHGTGSAAMVLGGAVSGGRVISDWPGLRQGDLYEGRDLRPTQSLHSLIGSCLAAHYAIDYDRLMRQVFPAAGNARFLSDIVAT